MARNNNRNAGSSGRGRTPRRSNAEFIPTVTPWQPTSAIDAELMQNFTKEPPMTPLQININGTLLELPKYNGIAWWFPKERNDDNNAIIERFFGLFFTVVNTVQTLSLLITPLVLIYNFGLLYSIASLPLTVPLASHLEDTFGPNYGSAYTSLLILQVAFFVLQHAVSSTTNDPNALVLFGSFVALLFVLGHLFCNVEKVVLGRTWNAALLAYGQLSFWIYYGLLPLLFS